MSRHFWRACDRGAGFSFVELLVTIIIAGIAFAAIVPMFVAANGRNSADNLRLVGLQIAQDKIEKVRQLAYGSIKLANLNSSTWGDSQFGQTQTMTTGTSSRDFQIRYTVTPYPAAGSGIQSEYKVVTVETYWTGAPTPVKHTFLSTIVYRQYAGPPITGMTLTPGMNDDGILGDDSLSSVLIKAHVDLSSGAVPAYLQFTIAGPSPSSKKILVTETNTAAVAWYDGLGNFYWRWDCPTVPNGTYEIYATAFTSEGFVGNTFRLYPRIEHVIPVAPPSTVSAEGYDSSVTVNWSESSDANRTQYQVYRSTSATGPWDATTLLTTVDKAVLTYTDPTVTNDTTYYYAIVTLVSDGRSPSTPMVSNSVMPSANTDVTPPTAPINLVAAAVTGASTINLTWQAATDPGVPTTGVKEYEVYRSSDGANWSTTRLGVTPSITYPDATAGFTATSYYKVLAVDYAGHKGPFSNVASATTGAFPHHRLTISVKSGNNASYVWVLYQTSGNPYTTHYFNAAGDDLGTNPGSGVSIAKNGSVTFNNLPDGDYTVFATPNAAFSSTHYYGISLNGADTVLTNVTPS